METSTVPDMKFSKQSFIEGELVHRGNQPEGRSWLVHKQDPVGGFCGQFREGEGTEEGKLVGCLISCCCGQQCLSWSADVCSILSHDRDF